MTAKDYDEIDGVAITLEDHLKITLLFLEKNFSVESLTPDLMFIKEPNSNKKQALVIQRFDEEDAALRGAPLQMLWYEEDFDEDD